MSISRARLEASVREVADVIRPIVTRLFGRRVGFTIFLFGYGSNENIAYLSTAERETMIATVKEWLARQEAGLATDPAGPTAEA